MKENAEKGATPVAKTRGRWTFRKETIFTLLMLAVAVIAFQQATTFPFGSGLYPMVIAMLLILLATGQVITELRQKALVKETMDVKVEEVQKGPEAMRRAKRWLLWFLGIYASIFLVGFQFTIVAFFLVFMWREGHFKWWRILLLAGICAVLIFWVLTGVLQMDWQRGLLQEWLYWRD